MAGIYIHIPFCKQACNYCNFHFLVSLKGKNDFVAALLKEIGIQREYLQGGQVSTIYFGGGTPSLMSSAELKYILEEIRLEYRVSADAEITLEANPDDINTQKLREWRGAGINRLSIGVQSFFEDDLVWMNRAHNASQSLQAIGLAKQAGFDNLTIDLIYGVPGMSDDSWEKNVKQAIDLGIPHLSCYALTVEAKTPLNKLIASKKVRDVNTDDQARQFLLLMDWLSAAGYEHYEISNFALPGKRSRHNTSYWQNKKYLGLGPSAHSYNGLSRQWNVASNARYIRALEGNSLLFEKEDLTPIQKLNEYIMTSLRTIDGCDLREVERRFGENIAEILRQKSFPYLFLGEMEPGDDKLVLTKAGKLLADGIASDLFFL